MRKIIVPITDECIVTLEISDALHKSVSEIAKKKGKSIDEVAYFALMKYGNPLGALNSYLKYNSER